MTNVTDSSKFPLSNNILHDCLGNIIEMSCQLFCPSVGNHDNNGHSSFKYSAALKGLKGRRVMIPIRSSSL